MGLSVFSIPLFTAKKPEKLETFNESERTPDKLPENREQGVLQNTDKNPSLVLRNSAPSLKPGQRFFILNGQPLFSNYQFQPYGAGGESQNAQPLSDRYAYTQANQNLPVYSESVSQFLPQNFNSAPEQFSSLDQQSHSLLSQFPFSLRNSVSSQTSDVNGYGQNVLRDQFPAQNFVSLNQPHEFKENEYLTQQLASPGLQQYQNGYPTYPYIRTGSADTAGKVEARYGRPGLDPSQDYSSQYQVSGDLGKAPLSYYQYETTRSNLDDDTVVVDASVQNGRKQGKLILSFLVT